MKKSKDYNYDNFKPKDKTSGSITLTPKTKEGPIGPTPPRPPKPRMTLTKLADTVNKLAEMFVEFRSDVNSRFDKIESNQTKQDKINEQVLSRLNKLEKSR
jgi:hypothetical protein